MTQEEGGGMDQETRWLMRYNEVVEFINDNHRNPSKHRIEEHDMLNWLRNEIIQKS